MLDFQRDLRMNRRARRLAEAGGVRGTVDYRALTPCDREAGRRVAGRSDVALDGALDYMRPVTRSDAARPVVSALLTVDPWNGG